MKAEKIALIRDYLKENTLGYIKLSNISRMFKVSGKFIRDAAHDLIKKQTNTGGIIRNSKGEITHAILDNLPGLLGYSYSGIRKNMFGKKIAYVIAPYERVNEKTGKKRLIYARFYKLSHILNLFPRYRYNYNFYHNLDKQLLRKFLKVENIINEREYHILCWMFTVKNESDIWPSENEIMFLLKNKFSLMTISRSINRLVTGGFIKIRFHEFSSVIKTRYSYIALKGPSELLLTSGRLRDYCAPRCKLF